MKTYTEKPDTDKTELKGKELLKEMVDLGGKHARRILITEGAKQLTPVFHLVAADGAHQIVAAIWTNDDEKDAVLGQVRQIAHQMNAVAVMMINEAWMASYDKPLTSWHADRQGPYVRPSERPDRKEVVIASALDNEDNNVTQTWQIVRSRPGGPIIALMNAYDSEKENMGFKPYILERILPKR